MAYKDKNVKLHKERIYRLTRRIKRRILGVCIQCGENECRGLSVRCLDCRINNRKYDKVRVKKCKESNICVRCRTNKAKDSETECGLCQNKIRIKRLKQKLQVFSHYGNKCNCCNETMLTSLQIDHINNDGYIARRKKLAHSGNKLYLYLINNNFPDGFQLLCANCNFSKRMNNGICEHNDPGSPSYIKRQIKDGR